MIFFLVRETYVQFKWQRWSNLRDHWAWERNGIIKEADTQLQKGVWTWIVVPTKGSELKSGPFSLKTKLLMVATATLNPLFLSLNLLWCLAKTDIGEKLIW